jgi:hypothetical protein
VGVAALLATVHLIRSRKRKAAAAAAGAAPGTQPGEGDGYMAAMATWRRWLHGGDGYMAAQPKPAEAYGPHELVSEGLRQELPVPVNHYRPYELPS